MKKSILTAAVGAVTLIMMAFTSAQAGVVGPMSATNQAEPSAEIVHQVGRRGRHLAIGALATLGIIGAIAASKRAHARPRYYYEGRRRSNYHRRCRRLLRWCRRGDDEACWRYDNRC